MANKDYQRLIRNIENRSNPENVTLTESYRSELGQIAYKNALQYIRRAMHGVEPEYTERTKEAGKRVKENLENKLSNKSYRYQGSVMTNTHIKAYSDIDLLVIEEKFFSYSRQRIEEVLSKSSYSEKHLFKLKEVIESPPYIGDALEDLRVLRLNCEDVLTGIYLNTNINEAKCIKVVHTGLGRKIDVVIANWYHNVEYILNSEDTYKAIQVYDKHKHKKGKVDYPFLSIDRINTKGSETNGRLKKMIRFLKTVKGDSAIDITLTSFDINAICYDIDVNIYKYKSYYELLPIIYIQIDKVINDFSYRYNLKSVDGYEYIFRQEDGVSVNNEKVEELKKLQNEVILIIQDIEGEL